ncbi:hypothetical protein D3C87_1709890 [compost metagenome]
MNAAPLHRQFDRLGPVTIGNLMPCGLHRRIRTPVERRQIDGQIGILLHPVIGRTVQRHHIDMAA